MGLWTPTTKTAPVEPLGDLQPKDVLWEFQGPRLFTCLDSQGELLLAHQCDEEADSASFLLVPFSEELLEKLKSDVLSVREALHQPRGWVVRLGPTWKPEAAWSVSLRDIESDMLPEPFLTLHDTRSPLLTLKLVGERLTAGAIPASVIRGATERPIAALKRLMEYLEQTVPEVGKASASWVRRFYDLPTTSLTFGSVEIAFGRPTVESDLFARDSTRADDPIIAQLAKLLQRGIDLVAPSEATTWETGKDNDEVRAVTQAIYELSPAESGIVDEIQLGGTLVRRRDRTVRLSRATRASARAILKRLDNDNAHGQSRTFITTAGVIEGTDLGRLTCTLRQLSQQSFMMTIAHAVPLAKPTPLDIEEIVFEMDEEHIDQVMDCQRGGQYVMVFALEREAGKWKMLDIRTISPDTAE